MVSFIHSQQSFIKRKQGQNPCTLNNIVLTSRQTIQYFKTFTYTHSLEKITPTLFVFPQKTFSLDKGTRGNNFSFHHFWCLSYKLFWDFLKFFVALAILNLKSQRVIFQKTENLLLLVADFFCT